MKVKDLITKLLDYNMDADVKVVSDTDNFFDTKFDDTEKTKGIKSYKK